jgi:hypothetical protein
MDLPLHSFGESIPKLSKRTVVSLGVFMGKDLLDNYSCRPLERT